MRKLDFWRADWFLEVVVARVVPGLSGRDLIQSLERKAYNLGVQSLPGARQAVQQAARYALAAGPPID